MDEIMHDCCENVDGVTVGYSDSCPYAFDVDGCAGDGGAKCAARASKSGLMAHVVADVFGSR